MRANICNILIMAGGTGGHVYPAISVAKSLMNSDVNIKWIGTKTGIEEKIVNQAGIKMIHIKMSGFAGKGIMAKIKAISYLGINTLSLMIRFIFNRPSAVIGFGGYVSLPGAIAARILMIPVLLHEQNSKIGVANKIINKISNKTMLAFKDAAQGKRVIFTGNPVRDEICDLKSQHKTYTGSLKILVMGGSLGAKFFNEKIMDVFSKDQNIHVLHQCGKFDLSEVKQRYLQNDINVDVVEYINDVAEVYKDVDLVICRAGAMTVSELMCAAIPAIYIPYPYAIYNHQYHNAAVVQNIGGGFVVNEDENAIKKVAEIIRDIFSDKESKLSEMRKRLLGFNYQSGTELITKHCLEYC